MLNIIIHRILYTLAEAITERVFGIKTLFLLNIGRVAGIRTLNEGTKILSVTITPQLNLYLTHKQYI